MAISEIDDPSLDLSRLITYRIDSRDRLVYTNQQWDTFATANSAETLCSNHIKDRSLWDFISGADMQAIYRILLERVRAKKKPVYFPYRCDSPELKRFMHMSVVPFQSSDDVQLYSRELKSLPQPRVAHLRFVNEKALVLNPFLRCSICNHFFVDGIWLEIETALERANMFDRDGRITVMSSVCGHCSAAVLDA